MLYWFFVLGVIDWGFRVIRDIVLGVGVGIRGVFVCGGGMDRICFFLLEDGGSYEWFDLIVVYLFIW